MSARFAIGLMTFCVAVLTACSQTVPPDSLEEANVLVERDEPHEALEAYRHILTKSDTGLTFFRAMFAMARIYRDLGESDSAMMIYHRVLGSRADKVIDEMERGFYRSVPRLLVEMHREAKRYDSVLHYLDISDSISGPPALGCGNAFMSYNVNVTLSRIDLYLLANQRDNLLEKLAQYALEWNPEYLPAVRALDTMLTSDERRLLQIDLEKALARIEQRVDTIHLAGAAEEIHEFSVWCIRPRGWELYIGTSENQTAADTRRIVRKSRLYEMLNR